MAIDTETYAAAVGKAKKLISELDSVSFSYVETLPTTNIKTNVLYLVPKKESETGNLCDEYINFDGTTSGWEKIGSTEVDLSGYALKSEIPADASKLPYDDTYNTKQKIDSLDASAWIQVDVTGKSRKIWLRKINKLVEFWYWTDENLSENSVIATIPEGYRPSVPFYPYYILVKDLQKDSPIFRLVIYGDGTVNTDASGSTGWIYFHNFWTIQ